MKALFAGLLLLAVGFGAKAQSVDSLNGTYIYLAPDANFKISRFEIKIAEGKITFPGDVKQVQNIPISEGAQDDFKATLKNSVPAGVNFYKIEADLSGSGEALKVTLLQQFVNDENPRLAVYAISEGRPAALMHAFLVGDEAQMKGLADEENRLK